LVAYLFLGVVLLVGVILLMRWAADADPRVLARIVKGAGVALAVAGALLLVWRSPLGLVLLLAAASVLYFLRRAGRSGPPALSLPSPGLQTAMLTMTAEPGASRIDGTVRQGRFQGSRLSRLTLAQLLDLLEDYRRQDADSASALEAYLDRTYGATWHEDPRRSRRARPRLVRQQAMTRKEALEVLGLGPDSSTEEISEAHHRLLQKVDPDQGGSSYLAARIKQARDVLLGE
jgi:hypothetical protein